MWYALIFISFLGINHLQIDTTKEYSNYYDCIKETAKTADDLYQAFLEEENSSLIEKPKVIYTCKNLPFRKT